MIIQANKLTAIIPAIQFKNEIELALPKNFVAKCHKWDYKTYRYGKKSGDLVGIIDNPEFVVPYNVSAKYFNPLAFKHWAENHRQHIPSTRSLTNRDMRSFKKG